MMKRIIHLSDLHVGHGDCSYKFRNIIDSIIFLKQPAKNYIILITGDIVDNANHSEQIDEAVEAVEKLEECGYRVLASSTHKNGNNRFQRVIDLSNADPRMDYDGNFI